jgi:hypothetical protein
VASVVAANESDVSLEVHHVERGGGAAAEELELGGTEEAQPALGDKFSQAREERCKVRGGGDV